jgi:hypothetical protein
MTLVSDMDILLRFEDGYQLIVWLKWPSQCSATTTTRPHLADYQARIFCDTDGERKRFPNWCLCILSPRLANENACDEWTRVGMHVLLLRRHIFPCEGFLLSTSF